MKRFKFKEDGGEGEDLELGGKGRFVKRKRVGFVIMRGDNS